MIIVQIAVALGAAIIGLELMAALFAGVQLLKRRLRCTGS